MSIVSLLHIWGYSWEFLVATSTQFQNHLFPGLNWRIAWHLAVPLIWGFCKKILLPMWTISSAFFFSLPQLLARASAIVAGSPGVSCMPTWKVLSFQPQVIPVSRRTHGRRWWGGRGACLLLLQLSALPHQYCPPFLGLSSFWFHQHFQSLKMYKSITMLHPTLTATLNAYWTLSMGTQSSVVYIQGLREFFSK